MAAARSQKHVRPGISIIDFEARGSGGWKISVSTFTKYQGKPGQSFGLTARGPHHESVRYDSFGAKITEDGDIVAKLNGLGRIAVSFDQTSEQDLHVITDKGCKAEGETVVRKGFVRGLIRFHGEGGYTTVERQNARAQIIETPNEICSGPTPKPAPEDGSKTDEVREKMKYLLAGRKLRDGELTFTAFSTPAPFSDTEYTASYTRKRNGLFISASTSIDGEKIGVYSMTKAEGTPTEAQVNPPAPFTGSGTFKLETPTEASWSGDLSVEVPILGRVSLTAPGSWAGACATNCTATFPEGFSVGFGFSSRLP